MKLTIQYVNDSSGKVNAVLVNFSEWKKLITRMKQYEDELRLNSDLQAAFREVEQIQKGKLKRKSLSQFLDEL